MSRKIDDYWNLEPARFKYLESFELRRDVQSASAEPYHLSITLMEEPQAFSLRGRFEFFGVQGIRIGSLDGLLGLMFEIADEAHNQLEGLNYRVVESEHHAFSFWCQDFDFEVLP